MKILNFSNVKP